MGGITAFCDRSFEGQVLAKWAPAVLVLLLCLGNLAESVNCTKPLENKNGVCTPCPDGEGWTGLGYCLDCPAACPNSCERLDSTMVCNNCSGSTPWSSSIARSCLSRCVPNAEFPIEGHYCRSCSAQTTNCWTCNTTGYCTECSWGFVLNSQGGCDLCNGWFYNGVCHANATEGCSLIYPPGFCGSCFPGYKLHPFTLLCYKDCPANTYETGSSCSPKYPYNGCLEYSKTSSYCTKCAGSMFLKSGSCSYCSTSQYYDKPTDQCAYCTSNCWSCPNGECEFCGSYSSLIKSNHTCASQPSCPDGFYVDTDTNLCTKRCPTSCASCLLYPFGSPLEGTYCTQCNSSTFLNDGRCVAPCPTGRYGSAGVCFDCPANCNTCNSSGCSKCNPGFTLYSPTNCSTSCASDSFYDKPTSTCPKCSSRWENCVQCTDSQCSQCAVDTFAYNGSCWPSCPPKTYTAGSVCYDVHPNGQCEAMDKDGVCIACIPGWTLQSGSCYENISAICSPGTFQWGTDCVSCSQTIPHCANCSDPITCQDCQYGYKAVYGKCELCQGYVDAQGKCQEGCPMQYCTRCLQNGTCTKCLSGWTLTSDNICSPCAAGMASINNKCVESSQLIPHCLISQGAGCMNCEAGYTRSSDSTQCVAKCPVGYYPAGGQCALCSFGGCLKCTETGVCTDCPPGQVLLRPGLCNTCGNWATYFNGTCYPCYAVDPQCQTCSSVTECTECGGGTYLYQGKCVFKCPTGLFSVGGVCKASCPSGTIYDSSQMECITQVTCNSNCAVCSTTDGCLKCNSGLLLQLDGSCSTTCPPNTFNFDNVCRPCNDHCAMCNTSGCMSCASGYHLVPETKACRLGCTPWSSFLSPAGVCQDCSQGISHCSICSSTYPTVCSLCEFGYYLNSNGLCSQSCPTGYVKSITTGKCKQCSSDQYNLNEECTYCADNGCPGLCDFATGKCVLPECGNGVVTPSAGEECDVPMAFCNTSTCKCAIGTSLSGGACTPYAVDITIREKGEANTTQIVQVVQDNVPPTIVVTLKDVTVEPDNWTLVTLELQTNSSIDPSLNKDTPLSVAEKIAGDLQKDDSMLVKQLEDIGVKIDTTFVPRIVPRQLTSSALRCNLSLFLLLVLLFGSLGWTQSLPFNALNQSMSSTLI